MASQQTLGPAHSRHTKGCTRLRRGWSLRPAQVAHGAAGRSLRSSAPFPLTSSAHGGGRAPGAQVPEGIVVVIRLGHAAAHGEDARELPRGGAEADEEREKKRDARFCVSMPSPRRSAAPSGPSGPHECYCMSHECCCMSASPPPRRSARRSARGRRARTRAAKQERPFAPSRAPLGRPPCAPLRPQCALVCIHASSHPERVLRASLDGPLRRAAARQAAARARRGA